MSEILRDNPAIVLVIEELTGKDKGWYRLRYKITKELQGVIDALDANTQEIPPFSSSYDIDHWNYFHELLKDCFSRIGDYELRINHNVEEIWQLREMLWIGDPKYNELLQTTFTDDSEREKVHSFVYAIKPFEGVVFNVRLACVRMLGLLISLDLKDTPLFAAFKEMYPEFLTHYQERFRRSAQEG